MYLGDITDHTLMELGHRRGSTGMEIIDTMYQIIQTRMDFIFYPARNEIARHIRVARIIPNLTNMMTENVMTQAIAGGNCLVSHS